MKKYNPQKIEKIIKEKVLRSSVLSSHKSVSSRRQSASSKKKYYVLDMFPYPSGDGLHMGHTESYTASDIIYRYKKLRGYDVLHPQGFDAFGLPAENYAVKTGIHPKKTTEKNIKNYIRQMKMLGLGYDYDNLIQTSDPSYYRWTQWLFGKFFENGLVERKTDKINWCPSCQTAIANEQVVDGKCERCKTRIEQKEVKGWFFKITNFAEDLINDLDKVDWPEATKKNQRNWIGQSNGALLNFEVRISNFDSNSNDKILNEKISVFTTRPDTLFGATYLVLAPEHPLIEKLKSEIKNWEEVKAYVKRAKNKTEMERLEGKEKTGVKLEGLVVINPAIAKMLSQSQKDTERTQNFAENMQNNAERTQNNAEKNIQRSSAISAEIPIFVADYVLGDYGTGAIMAVPAHDERDYEFATCYNKSLNIIEQTRKNATAARSQNNADLTRNNAEEVRGGAEKIEIRQVIAPHFVDKNNPPRPVSEGKKLVPRRAVQVVVKHWSENKILNLHWKKFPWKTFIVGGVKPGETPEEAAIREVREETGYKNVKSIKPIAGEFHSEFFAAHKDVNRYAYVQGFYLELENGEQDEFDREEHEIFDLVWTDVDKVKEKLTSEDIKVMWDNLQNSNNVYTGPGKLINSGPFDGMDSEEAKKAITEFVGGEMTVNYRLRDWSISRQRYWGCPIPIVYSPEGKAKFVGEENLPWLLPEDVDFVPTGTAPLAKSKELKERTEKIFGPGWTPEVDTMDTFVDSSWYFLRYPDPKNEREFCSREKLKEWLPVDLYIGGAEHTYMHLLYARFFVKAMHKIGLLDFDEPFLKLRHQGMVLDKNGVKMSKSKGNVINPDEMVKKFGADATRMYMMFAAPLDEDVIWNEEGVKGVYRFLEKIFSIFERARTASQSQKGAEQIQKDAEILQKSEDTALRSQNDAEGTQKELLVLLHKTIKGVTEDIEELKFNTAISKMMIFINTALRTALRPQKDVEGMVEIMEKFLILLSPFAPHISEYLWEQLGKKDSIFEQKWPNYDPEIIKEKTITLVIQVNGRVRDSVEAPADLSEEDAHQLVLAREKIKKRIEEKQIKRILFVKGKLVNIVTE